MIAFFTIIFCTITFFIKIIIFCSTLVTLNFNVNAKTIEKFALNSFNWIGVAFYSSLISIFLSLSFLLFKKPRKDIIANLPNFRKNIKLFFINELVVFGGNIAGTYALSFLAVIELKAINSSQSFFVLLYSFLLSQLFGIKFKEKSDTKSIIKKIFCFCIIIIGIILITHNELK